MYSDGSGEAVRIQGAYKRYSPSAVVLRGLELTVPEASIFGLLGPSGCGKTTLLRSIVGMVRLDAGEIYVKAQKRSKVGFMPQELGLYNYMKIMEAFKFYGKLYGMESKEVETRGKELVDFLELPDSNRLIGTLSGGQQRRLSFAVTLIHDPDLLILDEPTVGIDPILSAAIWERLLEMATCHRKTIIITTHYIEEARQAHVIGLMRDGILLAQQPPLALMRSQGCDTLEGAFLSLSQKQHTIQKENELIIYPPKSKKVQPPLVDTCSLWKTSRFMAQLDKNVTWLWRNLRATILFLLLPGFISFICQIIMAHDPGKFRTIGIVSPELSGSMDICNSLEYTGCDNHSRPIPCRFIEYLNNATIYTILFDDLESGKEATRRNKIWGVLSFSDNYTESAVERMRAVFSSTTDGILESSFIDAHLDMSNTWVSTFLRREFMHLLQNMIKEFLEDCNMNPKMLDIPIRFNDAVYGRNEPLFLEFFIPGVVCTFAFYLSIMFTSSVIMFEKSVGLERSLVAGLTKLEVIIAHSCVQLSIAFIQQVMVLFIFYWFFADTCKGSIYLILLLLVLLQFMGLFFGLIVGLFFKSERDASNAGVGVVNFLFMTAGLMWPVEGMHSSLRNIIWAFPVQPAVESYRSIAMRGWNIAHPVVYHGFVSTIIWSAIFILLTVALCKTNKTSL